VTISSRDAIVPLDTDTPTHTHSRADRGSVAIRYGEMLRLNSDWRLMTSTDCVTDHIPPTAAAALLEFPSSVHITLQVHSSLCQSTTLSVVFRLLSTRDFALLYRPTCQWLSLRHSCFTDAGQAFYTHTVQCLKKGHWCCIL